MAAFEFGSFHQNPHNRTAVPEAVTPEPVAEALPEPVEAAHLHPHPQPPIIQEPILTLKIYDSCRSKDCLGPQELGPVRDFDGNPIHPPAEARSVTIDNPNVCRISIMKKQPSPFRNGFWDIEIQYLLEYEMRYFGADGSQFDLCTGYSTITRRVSLFGSVGRNISSFTDLFGNAGIMSGNGEPFVHVEAKAMPLTAEIVGRPCPRGEEPPHRHIVVTLGLFSIVKLFRVASLLVESRGFLIPPVCRNLAPTNPCDFFDELHFPMDSFSPPQKREFAAGISLDIPSGKGKDSHCGCTSTAECDIVF
ncbi:MAG: hypothetical protein FWB98_05155 [Defluviitaleaceae bacterium]|nr:hypothetical protein [Defluviitaleaceae bacterium]